MDSRIMSLVTHYIIAVNQLTGNPFP